MTDKRPTLLIVTIKNDDFTASVQSNFLPPEHCDAICPSDSDHEFNGFVDCLRLPDRKWMVVGVRFYYFEDFEAAISRLPINSQLMIDKRSKYVDILLTDRPAAKAARTGGEQLLGGIRFFLVSADELIITVDLALR